MVVTPVQKNDHEAMAPATSGAVADRRLKIAIAECRTHLQLQPTTNAFCDLLLIILMLQCRDPPAGLSSKIS